LHVSKTPWLAAANVPPHEKLLILLFWPCTFPILALMAAVLIAVLMTSLTSQPINNCSTPSTEEKVAEGIAV
jgi:hypothetical protein